MIIDYERLRNAIENSSEVKLDIEELATSAEIYREDFMKIKNRDLFMIFNNEYELVECAGNVIITEAEPDECTGNVIITEPKAVEGAYSRYIFPESQSADVTGNENNGVDNNITYNLNGSAVCNGIDSYVDTLISPLILRDSDYFSIGVIAKSLQIDRTNYRGFLGNDSGTDSIFMGEYNNGNFQFGLYHSNNTSLRVNIPSANVDENFHYFVMTVNDNILKIYQDDVLVAQANISLSRPSGTFKLGRTYNTSDRYFKGELNAFEIYNSKALNESEILQNYDYYKFKGVV